MWSSMNSNVALYKVFLFVVCLVGMNAVVFAQQTERSRVYEAKVMLSFENNLPPLLGTVQGVRFCESGLYLGGILNTGFAHNADRQQWALKTGFYPAWYWGEWQKVEAYLAVPISFFHYQDDIDYPNHRHVSRFPYRGGLSVTPEIGVVRKFRNGQGMFFSLHCVLNKTLYDSYRNNDLVEAFGYPETGLGVSIGYQF